MLDAYVIEEIKRRDRERTRDERPAIELPLPSRDPSGPTTEPEERKEDRGVVISDYSG
jgi:hypothetical protein